MPQPLSTQVLQRSSHPSALEQYPAPPQEQPPEGRCLNRQPQRGRRGSRYGPGRRAGGAAPSRITLIVAWWGAERVRTATSAPPLVPPRRRGDMGPQSHAASVPFRAGGEDGLAAVTVTTGEGGQGIRGEALAVKEDRKRRWAAVVPDAQGDLVHVVEEMGVESAEEEDAGSARGKKRLLLQLAGSKGPNNGAVDDGGRDEDKFTRFDNQRGRACAAITTTTTTTTAPMSHGSTGSESNGESSENSAGNSDTSGSTGQTPTSSGSTSHSRDCSSGDDEDDNDDVDREKDTSEEDVDEEEQQQSGDGGTRSMARVARYWRHDLDWRHAGALRTGMLLPPLTTRDGLLSPCKQRPNQSQSSEPGSISGEVRGTDPQNAAAAERFVSVNNRSDCISGVTRICPAKSPPRTNRLALSWRHWFAALRKDSSQVPAIRVGVSREASGEGGATGPPLQWKIPPCISPAWVRVKRPPGSPISAASSGDAVATAAAGITGAAGEGIEVLGPAKAEEGSSRDIGPAGGDVQLPSPAPTSRWSSEWGLGQQAVRGMAIALGLAPAMVSFEGHRRQQPMTRIKQQETAEGREEEGEEEAEEQEEVQDGDGSEEEEQSCMAALHCVMGSLELPGLRVFLRHPRELERLYLPPPPSVGADSFPHRQSAAAAVSPVENE
ncbi:hypothetical protein Vretifemale_6005 [Volvox reticuliferus]|nr:hypothetical protein Vretifemale_6005 [Volvox reticuliferus]